MRLGERLLLQVSQHLKNAVSHIHLPFRSSLQVFLLLTVEDFTFNSVCEFYSAAAIGPDSEMFPSKDRSVLVEGLSV